MLSMLCSIGLLVYFCCNLHPVDGLAAGLNAIDDAKRYDGRPAVRARPRVAGSGEARDKPLALILAELILEHDGAAASLRLGELQNLTRHPSHDAGPAFARFRSAVSVQRRQEGSHLFNSLRCLWQVQAEQPCQLRALLACEPIQQLRYGLNVNLSVVSVRLSQPKPNPPTMKQLTDTWCFEMLYLLSR